MTKEDQALIKAFVENKPLLQAVRNALLEDDEVFPISVDRTLDDDVFGRKVKVWMEAREVVKERFDKLVRITSSNPQPAPINEAR